jgi:pimeloyl-ACP methyl ester carboxylesterase
VIFQHGGGQSMTNYLWEALILARAGVISIISDAPARSDGKNSELAEIVVTERRALDLLLQQPGIDPKRIAYVGHSYGAIAGGVLTGVEPRIAAFVLSGAVPSENHPDRYLPKARAPVLVQCARLDTDDNVRGCPAVHQIAGGPKQLIWYDDDHHFTSLEALRDRLAWLEKYLTLEALGPHIAEFLKR